MRADYAAAVRESVNVLIDHEFDIIPIDLDRIFEDLSRTIKKYSYSELAAKYDVTISFICDYFESDLGACAYLADREQYIIVYNDTKFNYGLDRFTIAHELGHFFLNHYAQVESNVLLRKRMPERKYKKFENEANCFARNLLAPVPLVERIIELDSPLSIQELQDAFNISYQAAKTRKGLFQADRYRMQTDYYTYFNGYEINFGYYCVSCGNAEIEASNFCKICGEVASIFDKTHNRTFYEGFALDKGKRICQCLQCGNKDFSKNARYCKICGTELFNLCINPDGSCGYANDGNARYCIKCGSETVFLNRGFLTGWREGRIKSLGGDIAMIYDDGVEMNEDMRVSTCPRCENEEFSEEAEYCRICGLRAYNYCEGEPEYDWNGYQTDTHYHRNPSNARYCETCGNPTIFFKEKILRPWKDVNNELEAEDDSAFAEVVATADDPDDFPF